MSGTLNNAIFNNASYLDPAQKQLATDTFNASVQPLQKSYQRNLDSTINNLSARGIAFSGPGNQNLDNLVNDQAIRESNIAQNIGVSLGQNALQNAFNSNEAAKKMEFEASQQTKQNTFSQQMQQAGFQQTNNQNALQLALNGNLKGQGVDNLINQQFGAGYKFTPQDDVDLKRVAQASGLSTNELLQLKSAIGQGQLADVIKNPGNYIDSPEKARQFQLQLAKISADAAKSGASKSGGILGGLLQAGGSILGAIYGGPAGAAAGNAAGSAIGNSIG